MGVLASGTARKFSPNLGTMRGKAVPKAEEGLKPSAVVVVADALDLSHVIQTWKHLERRHRERTGDQLPKDMRFAIFLSMCPTDLEKQLTAQQH